MFYSEAKGCWIERITLPNGRKKELTAKTQSELAKKLVAYNVQAESGRTFTECADKWEAAHSAKLEAKTAQSYAPHVRRAKEFFEGRLIKDIAPDEVQSYIDSLAENGMAKDTVHRALVVINKIFKWAITQPGSIIRINPCSAVEMPRGLKQTRREPPTEAQIVKVTPDSEMGLFAYFLLWTGLRPGELLGLRWEDIDREKKTISIRQVATYANNKAVVKPRAKTSAGIRTVPLLDVLDEALPRNQTGYVFGGDAPLTSTMFRKRWLAWCREVGLADCIVETHYGKNKHKYTRTIWKPKVTAYQFRHEYASMLEDENVSEFDAQHVMGHSSIVITKDIYTQFREKKQLQNSSVAAKLNARANKNKKA